MTVLVLAGGLRAAPPVLDLQRIQAFEEAIASDPENLRLAANYRQLMIRCEQFDRSIDLFEKLAKWPGSGPNVHISRALAYADKVPVSGDIRRALLGRDAINALTLAIERQPSALAYYVRGRINLFYNTRIYHRAHHGVEDLQAALALVSDDTPPGLVERIWVTLGDAHWRNEDHHKALETWTAAARIFPDGADLTARLTGDLRQSDFQVRHALDDNLRVDTSLRELVP